jgi:hypothetical protein
LIISYNSLSFLEQERRQGMARLFQRRVQLPSNMLDQTAIKKIDLAFGHIDGIR